jgi:predicted transcriptional regulator
LHLPAGGQVRKLKIFKLSVEMIEIIEEIEGENILNNSRIDASNSV